MPYRKKRYKRKHGGAPLNKRQVKAVSKIANKQIHKQSEMKIKDNVENSLTLTTGTGRMQKLDFPTAGTSYTERIGDQIYIKSLGIRSILDCENNQNNTARVIVVQDLQNDQEDGNISMTDILNDTTGARSVMSFYKEKPSRRWHLMYDEIFTWDSNQTNAPIPLNLKFSGKDFKIHKPNMNTVTGNTGAIYLGGLSEAGTAQLHYTQTRLRYHDN